MTEQPRAKGQFVQAGMIALFPAPNGSVVSHDGTLAMDSQYLKDDYPVLYEVIGEQYNDTEKGDQSGVHFRTPPNPTVKGEYLDSGFEWRIRF